MSQAYVQDSRLQGTINWDVVLPMSRHAGGHDEQMRALLEGSTVLGHWNEGDYQGSVATAVLLPDGRAAIYCDYYGSCSGCDAWEDASDEDVRKMCIDLANGAYIFPDPDAAIAWLTSAAADTERSGDFAYRWAGYTARGLLEAIEQGRARSISTEAGSESAE